MNVTSFNFNISEPIIRFGVQAVLKANEIVQPDNLYRIATAINCYLDNLSKTAGLPIYANLHAAARDFAKISDVLYLWALGSLWFRPINSDQMLNKMEIVNSVEIAILRALKEYPLPIDFDFDETEIKEHESAYTSLFKQNAKILKELIKTTVDEKLKDSDPSDFFEELKDSMLDKIKDLGVQFTDLNISLDDLELKVVGEKLTEDLLKAIEERVTKALIDRHKNKYAQLVRDNIASIKNATRAALDEVDKARYSSAKAFLTAVQVQTSGKLELKGVRLEDLCLCSSNANFDKLNPYDVGAVVDGISDNIIRGFILREIAENSLKAAFKIKDEKNRNEAKFREKLEGTIKAEIKTACDEDVGTVDVSQVPITKPSFLEKLYWAGITSAVLVNAISQGYEWQLYGLPSLSDIVNKIGLNKAFNFTIAPFSLGAIVVGSLFLGNLAKLFESHYRFVKIKDRDERFRTCWDSVFALANVILYGAALAGDFSVRRVNNITIVVKSFEFFGGLAKSSFAPQAPF